MQNDIPIVCGCGKMVSEDNWRDGKCLWCWENPIVELSDEELNYAREKGIAIMDEHKRCGTFKKTKDQRITDEESYVLGCASEIAVHKYCGLPCEITVYRGGCGDNGDFFCKGKVLDIKTTHSNKFDGLRIRQDQWENPRKKYDGYIATRRVNASSFKLWEILGTATRKFVDENKKLIEFSATMPPMWCLEREKLKHPSIIKKWVNN